MLRMNRRELLKYFAAGTLIAPVAGAAPVARLIESPKVELVKPEALIYKSLEAGQIKSFTVELELADGTKRRFVVDHPDVDPRGHDTGGDWNVFVRLAQDSTRSPNTLDPRVFLQGDARLA